MRYVTKHHPKQKGKSYRREEGRVRLLVSRDAVRLHDLLSRQCVGVCVVVRGKFVRVHSHNLPRRNFHDLLYVLEEPLEVGDVLLPDVDLPLQEVVVEFHFVELGVDLSFLHKIKLQIFVFFEHFTLLSRGVELVEELVQLTFRQAQ